MGVAAIIVPWNAPMILLIRSLAPALAAGCTTVVKPAPQTPLCNQWLIKLISEIEVLPKGVVNSINEDGKIVGERLVESEEVDVISFTGSSATGKAIMASAAGTLKRLSLELGGKAPAIVYPDTDLNRTVPQLVQGSLVIAGQMCVAITRILAHEDCIADLSGKLVEAFKSVKIGPGYEPSSQLGPLIDKSNQKRVVQLIEKADQEGELLLRGVSVGGQLSEGCFVSPSLVRIEDENSFFAQEEIFGPIVTLEPFADEKEAVKKANATRYGLSASLWTNDLHRTHRIARALKSGTVWCNSHGKLLAEAETGGYRQSGLGRLHGVEALDDFLETKHTYIEAAH